MFILSRATIRKRLMKYAKLFIERDCQYDDGHENAAIEEMLKNIYPIDPYCETFKGKLKKKEE
jgi:hypothetical protein